MARLKYCYNTQAIEDVGAYEAHYKKAKLAGGLFYAGKVDYGMLNRLYDDNPATKIVIRNWPDADQHLTMTPQQWIDRYAWESYGGRFIIGASNESNWGQPFLDWTLELCQKVVAMNGALRICIINLNSGHNTPTEWAQAREILKLACRNPDLIFVGLHEYAGGVITSGFVGGNPDGTVTQANGSFKRYPELVDYTVRENWPKNANSHALTSWHCGRYKFLIQYCEDEFALRPNIIITEFGFDFLSDIGVWLNSLPHTTSSVNGWRTLVEYWKRIFPNKSAEDALWEQIIYANDNIYDLDCICAVIGFCYGPNPDWTPYRVDHVLEAKIEAYKDNTVALPFNVVTENSDYTFTIPGGASLNIRPQTDLVKAPIGKLPSGSVAKVLSWYLQLNNNWCRINFNGLEGYVSLLTNTSNVDTVSLVRIVPPPVVVTPPPVVVPPPKPETNWDAVRAELDAAKAYIAGLTSKLDSISKLLP